MTAASSVASVAPLQLLPFLPQDNDSSSSSSSSNISSEETAQRAVRELGRCLALPFPVFLRLVLQDAFLGKFLDTFLRCVCVFVSVFVLRLLCSVSLLVLDVCLRSQLCHI